MMFSSFEKTKKEAESAIDTQALALMDVSLKQLGIPYEVEVTGQYIIIKANNKADILKIQKHIQDSHRTSDSFFASLPYTVLKADSTGPKIEVAADKPEPVHVETPPAPKDTVEEGVALLIRMFGEKVFKKHAIDVRALFDVDEGAFSKDLVLFSKKSEDEDTALLWNKYNQALLRRFFDVDVETIAQIWVHGTSCLPEPPKLAKDAKLSGKVQEFFGVITEENQAGDKEVRLYFKFGSMYRSLFQPEAAVDGFTLRLDKTHYQEYIQRISQGETLLTVYKPSKDSKQIFASPIVFGDKKVQTEKRMYDIIVDRSGSMQDRTAGIDYVAQIREHLRPFIAKLASFGPTDPLRTVFFDNKVEVEEYEVSNTQQIEAFYADKYARDSTELYKTIEDELDYLLKTRKAAHMFLISDGGDNIGFSAERVENIKRKLDLFKTHGLPMPQFFTFGFGNYDVKTLSAIADETGTPLIHLKSPADFDKVMKYQRTIQYENKIVNVVIGRGGISSRFEVPVTLDGNARSVNLLIPFQEGEKLQVEADGVKSVVVVNDARKVPVATVKDWTEARRIKMHTIVANDKMADNDRLKALTAIDLEIQTVLKGRSLTTGEQTFLNDVQKTLQDYTQDLNEIITRSNPGLRQSQITQAKYALGAQALQQQVVIEEVGVTDIMNPDNYRIETQPMGRTLKAIDEDEADEVVQETATDTVKPMTSGAQKKWYDGPVQMLVGVAALGYNVIKNRFGFEQTTVKSIKAATVVSTNTEKLKPKTPTTKKRTPPQSSFIRSLGVDDYLTVANYLVHFVNAPWTLYSNKERSLTDAEQKQLVEHQATLAQLTHQFVFHRPARAEKSGAFVDKFKFITTELRALPLDIQKMLSRKKTSTTAFGSLVTRLQKVSDQIKLLGNNSRDLKIINKMAKKLAKKSSHGQLGMTITEDTTTGRLNYKALTAFETQIQKQLDQEARAESQEAGNPMVFSAAHRANRGIIAASAATQLSQQSARRISK